MAATRTRTHEHTHTESTINQIDQQIDRVKADIYSPAALSAGIYVCVCACVCVLCHYDAESGHNVEGFTGKAEKMSTRDIKHGRRFLALYS